MRMAKHGEEGADHAVSYLPGDRYRRRRTPLAWIRWNPITGRAHHINSAFTPPAYGPSDSSATLNTYRPMIRTGISPGGIQNRLHLHARHIVIPHPNGGPASASAQRRCRRIWRQSWNMLGLDVADGDRED